MLAIETSLLSYVLLKSVVSMNFNANVISGLTEDSSIQFIVGGTAAAGGLLLLCIVIVTVKLWVSIF